MASTKTNALRDAKPEAPKIYYIVNPAGAIHVVDYEHARWRLQFAGWRSATAEEVAEYRERGGNQVHNAPICQPWTPEPVALTEPE